MVTVGMESRLLQKALLLYVMPPVITLYARVATM